MASQGNVEIARERCKGCGLCVTVCPFHLLELEEEINSKGYPPARPKSESEDGKTCTACTMCALVCPEVAIEVYRVS